MTTPQINPAAAERRPWVLMFVAVCLVAINLRMTITGVGPLLEEIADDHGVSVSALGALASLPLLAWGLFSPLAHGLSSRFGMSQTVSWSLVVLAAGTVWRSIPGDPANLWVGTALTGLGLAIGNVLMPAVIKRDFGARVPLVMGLYTALLGGLGALASGAVVPISQITVGGEAFGWRGALLATGVLLPIALVVWVWATRKPSPHDAPPVIDSGSGIVPPTADRSGRRIWGDPLAWLVSFYMGTQSAVFYMLSTWLAPYLTSLGVSPVAAGIGLMAFQLIGIVGSLLLPLASRGALARWAPAFIPAFGVVACIGFVAAPSVLPLWLIIGGLNSGASLTMALTLMATRARTHGHSSALSGMSQSVGYLIAAVGPTVFGWLHGWSGGWVIPFALVSAVALIQLLIGLVVGRARYVLEPRASASTA